MANHKSAIKRTRSDYSKNQHNKYLHKTTRNAIKKLKTGQVAVSSDEISKVFSLIDKLIKNNIIHKNKGANLKSKISKLEFDASSADNTKKSKEEKKSVRKKNEKKQEGDSNAKLNKSVEEVSAEEVSTEEVSTEEPLTEEAPTEEVSTEEAPTEEAPTEEVSTEEAPTEDNELKSTDSLEKE